MIHSLWGKSLREDSCSNVSEITHTHSWTCMHLRLLVDCVYLLHAQLNTHIQWDKHKRARPSMHLQWLRVPVCVCGRKHPHISGLNHSTNITELLSSGLGVQQWQLAGFQSHINTVNLEEDKWFHSPAKICNTSTSYLLAEYLVNLSSFVCLFFLTRSVVEISISPSWYPSS